MLVYLYNLLFSYAMHLLSHYFVETLQVGDKMVDTVDYCSVEMGVDAVSTLDAADGIRL